jgi:hypothetical protein
VVFNNATATKIINSDCSLPLGNNPQANSGGSITLNGTLSGTGTLTTSGTLTLGIAGVLSGFSGLSTASLSIHGAHDFTSYTTFSVGQGFLLASDGAFTAPSGTATFSGNFASNGGTFNANGGTAVFNGTGQSITTSVTFYNFTKTVTSADTLTFTAGSTQTITGRLTLSGSSGQLLSLVSDIPGSPWFIDAEGTTSVAYVDVSDSDASGGPAITTCNSVDSGGNSNWNFNPSSCNPSHGSGSSTALTNFELTQALLLIQSQQSGHNQATAAAAAGSGSLPSKIYDFVGQFPHGKELVNAATDFFKALLVVVFLLVVLAGLFLAWRRRKRKEEEEYTAVNRAPIIIRPSKGQTPPSDVQVGPLK